MSCNTIDGTLISSFFIQWKTVAKVDGNLIVCLIIKYQCYETNFFAFK